VVAMTASGAGRAFWDGFVMLNVRYTAADPLLSRPATSWALLRHGYGASLWLMLAGLVALVGLTVWSLSRRSRPPVAQPFMVHALTAGTALSLVFVLRDFDGAPDAFPLLPGAALGLGLLLGALTGALARRRTGLAVALALVGVVVPLVIAVDLAGARSQPTLAQQRRSVDAVLARLPPGGRIASADAPEALVLAHRVNPSPYLTFADGFQRYLAATWPGGWSAFLRHDDGPPVDAFVVQDSTRALWARWLSPAYVHVGGGVGWSWFVRRTALGPRQRHALHERLRAIASRD
jgi:hypothetical protein